MSASDRPSTIASLSFTDHFDPVGDETVPDNRPVAPVPTRAPGVPSAPVSNPPPMRQPLWKPILGATAILLCGIAIGLWIGVATRPGQPRTAFTVPTYETDPTTKEELIAKALRTIATATQATEQNLANLRDEASQLRSEIRSMHDAVDGLSTNDAKRALMEDVIRKRLQERRTTAP